jgi:hypothetical protein
MDDFDFLLFFEAGADSEQSAASLRKSCSRCKSGYNNNPPSIITV